MTFVESDVNREKDGKFGPKEGTAPAIALWAEGTPGRLAPDPDYVHKPGVFGGYEVRNFRSLPIGSEGGAYTANIYRDGKKVLTVENDGNGGMDTFTDVSGEHPTRHRGPELTRFVQASERMFSGQFEAESEMVQFNLWAGDVDRAVGDASPEQREKFIRQVNESLAEDGGHPLPDFWMEAAADPSIISRIAED